MKEFFEKNKIFIAIIIATFIIGGFIFLSAKKTEIPTSTPKAIQVLKITPAAFYTSTVSKYLDPKEEKKLLEFILNTINEYKTKEYTVNRPSMLQEETWLDISKFVGRVGHVWCFVKSEGKLGVSEGSGFLVNKEGNVLTNYHVVDGLVGEHCFVGFSSEYRQPPDKIYSAYLTASYDKDMDFAWLYLEKMVYPQEQPITSRSFSYIPACDSNIVKIGDPIIVLGYPVYGGETITATDGVISGSFSGLFKMSAKIDGGNSGGPVLLDDPQYECYVGIASYTVRAKAEITPESIEQLFYAIKTRSISGYIWSE